MNIWTEIHERVRQEAHTYQKSVTEVKGRDASSVRAQYEPKRADEAATYHYSASVEYTHQDSGYHGCNINIMSQLRYGSTRRLNG